MIALLVGVTAAKSATLYYLSNSNPNKTATSSTTYIVGGTGTTTVTFNSDGFEQASYLISLASSTTPPKLCWRNQFSNDGTFWYGEDETYASTTVSNSNEKENCWTYASTTYPATSKYAQLTSGAVGTEVYLFRKVTVKNLDTAHTRTIFYVSPGVNARLGIERNLKNEVIVQK